MLFRPSFCANCGEKIERAEWTLWASRRFCQVCETELKGHELIPKVIVGLGVLVGVFGFGSYLKSGTAADTLALKQPRRFAEQPVSAAPLTAAETAEQRAANTVQPAQQNLSSTSIDLQPLKPKPAAEESMYYCGAETKKGTPCSRRVKGNVRCFQHQGMPAMLPAGKLRVN